MQIFGRKSAKSTHRVSEELGVTKDTIHHHVNTLGKSYKSCKSVPQRRLGICRQPIGNSMDDRFIRRIVICDEKWVCYRNPDASTTGTSS